MEKIKYCIIIEYNTSVIVSMTAKLPQPEFYSLINEYISNVVYL